MKPYKNSAMAKAIENLNLNGFQTKALFGQPKKYDIDKLVKKGVVIYAPRRKQTGFFARLLRGPVADLIGEKKVLVSGRRGIKLYATGFFRAHDSKGKCYYADPNGHKISRRELRGIVF